MASLSHRIRAFLASPKSQQLIEQGQRQLAKPETQQKLRRLLNKLQGGR
jgi:hypothetical protein